MDKNSVTALIGCDAPAEVKSALISLGFNLRELSHDTRLQTPVRSQADMLIRIIGRAVFCSKEYYERNKELFEYITEKGYRVIVSNAEISALYPEDIALNVIYIRDNLIGRLDRCAAEILLHADLNGISKISVKQGYAACSTLLLGDKALISADEGIVKAALSLGISALKIKSSPAIRLLGYERGFIGGACGVFENTVYFCGSLDDHPDSADIRAFCSQNGFDTVSLCDIPLTDVGGIIFIPPMI